MGCIGLALNLISAAVLHGVFDTPFASFDVYKANGLQEHHHHDHGHAHGHEEGESSSPIEGEHANHEHEHSHSDTIPMTVGT